MQTASLFLNNALKEGTVLYSKPQVIAEWNHNRYTTSTVDNFNYPEADFGYDLQNFPISSITEGLRPTAGIAKARTLNGSTTTKVYSDAPAAVRYYTVGEDTKYKYWTGPGPSIEVPFGGGGWNFSYPVYPTIIYDEAVWTNKLYVCIENSWSNPSYWSIFITLDGTTWDEISFEPTINSKGQVILYHQEDDNWSSTVYRDNPIQIKGIQLRVESMVKQHAWFDLIELGARLESDLSDYVTDYSIKNEMSDPDFISPMGIISSNTASVTLSNVDGRFNNENNTTIYKGLIDQNVKFTISAGIDVSNWGGSGYEYVRLATMFTDSWQNSDEKTVEVSLKDASKFLQETTPVPELMDNVTVGQAIWRMLDAIGFNDYSYIPSANSPSTAITYFWTDSQKTVWQTIQDLCRGTQTACYFDEHGILQIKTRDSAFDKTKPVSWTADYSQNGSKNPDIISLDVQDNYESNKVTIKYHTTQLAQDTLGNPISEIIWQPDDDIVLRSSALSQTLNNGDPNFWVAQGDAPAWPYEGIVNIRGELIRYKGKGYRYYPGNYTGNFATDTVFKVIYSDDEKRQLDDMSNDFNKWRNYFTGYLRIEERAYDITTMQTHEVTLKNWTQNNGKWGKVGSTQNNWNGGIKHIPTESIMRLQSTASFKTGDYWYTAQRSTISSAPYKFYGTRMRFPSSPKGPTQLAGIWLDGNSARDAMYAIDIVSTAMCNRNVGNEIRVLKRSGSSVTSISGKGATFAVTDDVWLDIDVAVVGADFTVSVNGNVVLRATDHSATLQPTGSCGLYVRGNGVVDFEYFYALSDTGIGGTDLDTQSYLDLINGGYYSDQYYKDNLYQTRVMHTITNRRGAKSNVYYPGYGDRIFDEFGMLIHEVRPYEITFDKFPVLYSSLYVSNDSQSVVDEYTHFPYKAKFTVANAARNNAVLNGDDSLTYGPDNIVNQKMMITGRTIQVADAVDYVVTNDAAVRARGEISLEIDSTWVQSKDAAKTLGDWISDNWSEPSDTIQVEIYGNPLLQIGDIVGVNYPPNDMTSTTHKYWILSIDQSWSNGIQTTLTMRRARI